MLKPSDVLYRAIDAIHKYGWCQNLYQDEFGSMCALGSIRRVTHEEGVMYRAGRPRFNMKAGTVEEVHNAIETYTRENFGCCVAAFNDDPNTTEQDVLLAMKQVAVSLELEGR